MKQPDNLAHPAVGTGRAATGKRPRSGSSLSLLQTLSPQASAVVIGASGGIGGALVDVLSNDERIATLHALSRSGERVADEVVLPGEIDILDEASIASAAGRCRSGDGIDLVVVATGILHRGADVLPEKRMRDLDAGSMAELMQVNAIGPALVAKHFLPLMRRGGKSVFAAISARVGSIADNRLGGWASYRASKAALNMFIKTLSIEQSRSRPETICVALHPGTVDTKLSRPFQSRVAAGKLFDPRSAAERLLTVIDGLGPEDSGAFFAWDGSRIAY